MIEHQRDITAARYYSTIELALVLEDEDEDELRAPAAGAKIGVFCMLRLVCLRVGDIVQTSIV